MAKKPSKAADPEEAILDKGSKKKTAEPPWMKKKGNMKKGK